MNAIRATVRNGRLETDESILLPDGTVLSIPLPDDDEDQEEGWDASPEAIEAWIERTHALPSLSISEAEWAEEISAVGYLKEIGEDRIYETGE